MDRAVNHVALQLRVAEELVGTRSRDLVVVFA